MVATYTWQERQLSPSSHEDSRIRSSVCNTHPQVTIVCLLILLDSALQARRFAAARPSASASNGLEPPQIKQGRTRMPDSTPSTYDIVPVSQINPDDQRTNRPVGASAEDAMRRMKARLASGGPKKGKKGGLSIEGRGLH